MKKIFIYGYQGRIAKRYIAILNYLGHQWAGCDIGTAVGSFFVDEADGVIVASSTDSHVEILKSLVGGKIPVLCEKPICKDLAELRWLMAQYAQFGPSLQMVCQYDHLIKPDYSGRTEYNYYQTGPDGLPWDAMQIIHHANPKNPIVIGNNSPTWFCVINGQRLNIGEMDEAYVDEIRNWIERPRNDIGRILDIHERVAKMEATWLPQK